MTHHQPQLLEHVLVPVADDSDARQTARALEPYGPKRVRSVHVIEKTGGMDSIPLEEAKSIAEAAEAAIRETFPNAAMQTAYDETIVEGIHTTAVEHDVTAIAFRSRGGGRLVQLLTGDMTRKLVVDPPVPVVALPDPGVDSR